MNPGSYSNLYQALESSQVDHFRNERNDALVRAKKLQQETNKRRKAQAVKRKLEAQREEKRRQEILHKRRLDIKEATEKFQRLNKHYSKEEEDEAYDYQPTPGLDDALRAVRGSSASRPSRHGSAGSTHSYSTAAHTNPSSSSPSPSNSRVSSANTKHHQRPLSASRNLQDRSLRNLTNSRSLFEKQLEHHQRLLMEQQQQSLHHFNEAILQDMENDQKLQGLEDVDNSVGNQNDADCLRTESVSSLDSLEGGVQADNTNSVGVAQRDNSGDGGSAVHCDNSFKGVSAGGGFVLHRSSNSPNVAIVQPMSSTTVTHSVNPQGELKLEDVLQEPMDEGSKPGEEAAERVYGTIQTNSNGRYNGQYYQDSVVNYVNQHEAAPSNPLYYHDSSPTYIDDASPYDHNKYTETQPQVDTTAASKAWTTPYSTPANVAPSLQENTAYNANSSYMTNAKPYSSRQTSTNATVTTGYTQPAQTVTSANNSITPSSTATTSLYPNSLSSTNDNLYSHFGLTPPSENGTSSPLYSLNAGSTATTYSTTSTSAYQNSNTSGISQTTVSEPKTNPIPYSQPATSQTSNYSVTANPTHGVNADSLNSVASKNSNDVNGATSNGYGNSNTSEYQSQQQTTPTTTTTAKVPQPQQQSASTAYQLQQIATTTSAHNPKQNTTMHKNTTTSATPVRTQTTTTKQQQQKNKTPYSSNTSSTYYSYQVASNTRAAAKTAPKNAIPTIHDEEQQSEDGDKAEEEAAPAKVKGILKRREDRGKLPRKSVRIGGIIGKGSNRSLAASVRDSIEISRAHKEQKRDQPKQKKRHVRFADMTYEDENEDSDDTHEDDIEEEPEPPQPQQVRQPEPPSKPRPASAKMASTTPAATRASARAASAGTVRRGPFLRPHPPSHPPTGRATMGNTGNKTASRIPTANKPREPTINGASGSNHSTGGNNHSTGGNASVSQGAAYYSGNHQYGEEDNKHEDSVSGKGPVYGTNGLRLDRTPTDDEINWLWEKVRTCLHPSDKDGGGEAQQARQQTAVNTKYMDGGNLGRSTTGRTGAATGYNSSNYGTHGGTYESLSSQHAVSRKKVNMDQLNSYSRRASLLQQRKASSATSGASGGGGTSGGAGVAAAGTINYHQPAPSVTTVHSLQNGYQPQLSSTGPVNGGAGGGGYQQPPLSSTGPVTGGGGTGVGGYQQPEHVTESMAAFLAAEKLAQRSASESEIEMAMNDAQYRQQVYNAIRPQPKVSSALSIEEQRLITSLERLNDRLKAQESGGYQSTANNSLVPRPPAMGPSVTAYEDEGEGEEEEIPYQHTGFRGHAPKSMPRRQLNSNGQVTRHHFLNHTAPATAAPPSGHRTNQHTHTQGIRYR